MKWQKKKIILFSMHLLRLDFHSFSAAQICVCCVQQEIPTSDNPFANNWQTEGKFITYKPMYSNSFTSNINYLNTLLPADCSVIPCIYSSWELCSMFGINPLASNFPHCCPLLVCFGDFQRWSGKELLWSLISFLFSLQKWQASYNSAPLLWKRAKFKDHGAFYTAPLPE